MAPQSDPWLERLLSSSAAAVSTGPAAVGSGHGLFVARGSERPLADLLGLQQVHEQHDLWPDELTAVYLTAADYIRPFGEAAGHAYDPDAWLSSLLCQYTREEFVAALAQLNHITQHPPMIRQLLERTLTQLSPVLADRVRAALAGDVDPARGKDRVFLARPAVLRALRLAAHLSPVDEQALAQAAVRTGHPSRTMGGPLLCSVLLSHVVAEGLGAHSRSRPGEPLLGGLPESLAVELVCTGAFVRQGNAGNLLGRTLLLYRDYGARVTKPLRHRPLDLAEEALGMPLLTALAIAFYYYGATMQHPPVDTARALEPPAQVLQVAPGAVEAFLDRFASTADELAAAAEANRSDWANLHLQERPLLRLDDRAVVLDEAFLLERLTTGLFFLVLGHEGRVGGETARQQWRDAYAQMHELLVEDYLRGFAPRPIGGGTFVFDEDDLQRAYDPKNRGGGRADIGIDYGNSVLLADAVSGQLSIATRQHGDKAAFAKDIEQLVVKKARQLAGTVEKVTRDPQPAGGPLTVPATAVHAIVVPGGQFPVNPVTTRFIDQQLRADPTAAAMLNDPRVRGLQVLDLRDLEHAEAVRARDNCTLPELLRDWQADPRYAQVSLSDWLIATTTDADLLRPRLLTGPLNEVFAVIEELLIPPDERLPQHRLGGPGND